MNGACGIKAHSILSNPSEDVHEAREMAILLGLIPQRLTFKVSVML